MPMPEESKDAPHSRLFIFSSKQLTEGDFRRAFEPFGKIENIFMVKDKITGEMKGVTYIKFSKTSEAAKALEALNGESIGQGKPLKVMIASKPEEGNREVDFEEISHRLFVMIPKDMSAHQLVEVFKKYGSVVNKKIIYDKDTRESKGMAYVTFSKFSEAANAFENCDKSFKAVFARPKKVHDDAQYEQTPSAERSYRQPNKRRYSDTLNDFPEPEGFHDGGYNKLTAIVNPMLNQDQVWKLFDVVPSMDYCDLQYDGDRAYVEVVYKSSRWAAYAKQKFHGLEYPPGHRLIIRTEFEAQRNSQVAPVEDDEREKILKLAETLVKATSQIQKSGRVSDSAEILQLLTGSNPGTSSYSGPRRNPPAVDDFNLPRPRPLVEGVMRARCFVVCQPKPLPPPVLKDLFSRFDNLIDVFLLKGKNFGYAMYTSEQSANNAIRNLHGFEHNGVILKVVEAEDRPTTNKRKKVELDY